MYKTTLDKTFDAFNIHSTTLDTGGWLALTRYAPQEVNAKLRLAHPSYACLLFICAEMSAYNP